MSLFLEGDDLAGLDEVAGDVDLAAVDQDVAVADDLAGGPDGAADAEAADDVVETGFEEGEHGVAGITTGFLGHLHETAELALKHAEVELELLLLDHADAVFGGAAATVAVHAWHDEVFFGVLGGVGDRHTDAAGQTNFGTCITAHGSLHFPSGGNVQESANAYRLKTCTAAATADDLRAGDP